MPSDLKRFLTAEIRQNLEGVEDLVLVDASKLPAQKAGELRGKLEEAGVRLRVVKNRLAKRAFETAGFPALDDAFSGPTAILTGGEGAGMISRIIRDWNKKEPNVELKGGLLEGTRGAARDVAAWADLPSRDELLVGILTGILAPASGLGGAFQASLTQFLNLVTAHIDSMEKE